MHQRRELKAAEDPHPFASRVYLLKAEAQSALLDPETFERRMALAHRPTAGVPVKNTIRIMGRPRWALDVLKTYLLAFPTASYRVLKIHRDKKTRSADYVSDNVRIYVSVPNLL